MTKFLRVISVNKRDAVETKPSPPHSVQWEVPPRVAHTIPQKFLWFVDVLCLFPCFLIAYLAVPALFQVFKSWMTSIQVFAPSIIGPLLPEGVQAELPPPADLLWTLGVFVIAGSSTLTLLNCYENPAQLSRARIVFCGMMAGLASVGLCGFLTFLFRSKTSRLFVALFGALAVVGFSATRLVIRTYVRTRLEAGRYARNVVLVGPSSLRSLFLGRMRQILSPAEYRVVGYLGVESRLGNWIAEAPVLGSPGELRDELLAMLRQHGVSEVIILHPNSGGDWIEEVIRACDEVGAEVKIVLQAFLSYSPINVRSTAGEGLPNVPTLTLVPQQLRDLEKIFVKRMIDLVVSACALIILSPLFGLIAIAIKLTSEGPVFYRWRVAGQNGKKFVGYKFRTMVVHAEEQKKTLEPLNEMRGPVFKISNDPRVTPLGRILRKYSLDELPQLYSVLKGDMSLVGPRPVFADELDRFEFWHARKLSVRAGVTCLWQVKGRNKIADFDEWVRLDLEYIDQWSLWLDFKILLRTLWVVLKGTGR
ncbi:MAG: sugar transferase [Acidobacteria bacterium]|nr:sugar transferase [Acidobacteriota bacterium]